MAKKTTKRKVGKRKVGKKSAKKKPTKKKAAKKKTGRRPKAFREPTPIPKLCTLPAVLTADQRARLDRERLEQEDLTERIQVWESFERLHSRQAVAAETGHTIYKVRKILEEDRQRLIDILDLHREAVVARWEQAEARALTIVHDTLSMIEALINEVKAAVAEGRHTRILDNLGNPMPITSAVEFLISQRILDQQVNLATHARKHADAYRLPNEAGAEDAGENPTIDDFAKMNPIQLARIIEEGQLPVPPILKRKIERLRDAHAATQPAD